MLILRNVSGVKRQQIIAYTILLLVNCNETNRVRVEDLRYSVECEAYPLSSLCELTKVLGMFVGIRRSY